VIDPCVPRNWPRFTIAFRSHSAQYDIAVENPTGVSGGVSSVEVDGTLLVDRAGVPLADDGHIHKVRIILGSLPTSS